MAKSKLQKLKMNKAPVVDSVGTRMLLELSKELLDTVAELFTKTLDSGDVPLDLTGNLPMSQQFLKG